MPMLDNFDPFNFNPLSFGAAPGAAHDQDIAALLLRKGQQMGGLLNPQDQPGALAPAAESGPFRMPSGTPSLNSAPLPEVITGAPAPPSPGSALGFAPEAGRSPGGVPLPRPRPAGAPDDEEGAALPAAAQPAQGGLLTPAAPDVTPPASPSFLDRIGKGINDNSGLLIGLGAGLAGAPSWGTGISRGLAGAAVGAQTDSSSASANLTYNALLKKGVDPEIAQAAIKNPDLMKTLVTQTFGPQTVTSLGSGYVADKNGTIRRAFEPDDKTPNSALEYTFYKNNLAKGEAPVSYQKWLATKDSDPNKINVLGREGELWTTGPDGKPQILHKNAAEPPAPMEPDALEILARREIGGDFSGRKNLGRGAQGASDLKAITNKSSEILTKELGMTPTDAAAHLLKKQQEYHAQGQGLNSEARTTGVREANLNLILKAADAAIPAALEASDKVARGGWVPINKIIQRGEVMTSNPELKKFGMANLQLAEHWARAMNPTGVMRESDRDKALEFLSTTDSKETYKAAVGQLRTQIERERDAVRSTRGMSTMPGVAPESAAHTGAPPKAGAYIWTPGGGLVPGS